VTIWERFKAWLDGRPTPSMAPAVPASSCWACGGALGPTHGPHQRRCTCCGLPHRRLSGPLSRRLRYQAYLSSAEWAQKRRTFRTWWIQTYGSWGCAVCRTSANLNVHHLTYDRFGHEAMTDLLPVCAACHQQIHAQARRSA
jgi:hypothetical protein